jgi:hypothetical protein
VGMKKIYKDKIKYHGEHEMNILAHNVYWYIDNHSGHELELTITKGKKINKKT